MHRAILGVMNEPLNEDERKARVTESTLADLVAQMPTTPEAYREYERLKWEREEAEQKRLQAAREADPGYWRGLYENLVQRNAETEQEK